MSIFLPLLWVCSDLYCEYILTSIMSIFWSQLWVYSNLRVLDLDVVEAEDVLVVNQGFQLPLVTLVAYVVMDLALQRYVVMDLAV